MRSMLVVLLGCGLLAACGSTGQLSGTATGAANGASGDKSRDFEFARCMRAHGVPQFPDPAFSPARNTQHVLVMPVMAFAIPSSVNPKSPAFQRVARACWSGHVTTRRPEA
jgi:hypothetical protein